MEEKKVDLERFAPWLDAYASWIDIQGTQEAKHWCERLGADDHGSVEGAIVEAIAWDWLRCRSDEVALPAAPGGGPTPDFQCTIKGTSLHVEVECITRQAMSDAIGVPDLALPQGHYGSPADRLHREVLDKAKQGLHCGTPYLPLIATLHWSGSCLMKDPKHLEAVLHSSSFLAGAVNSSGPILHATDWRRAAFTKTRSHNPMRQHMSGVLFGPFGLPPEEIQVHGLLNPDASHPMPADTFDDVPLCSFVEWPPQDGSVKVHWSK